MKCKQRMSYCQRAQVSCRLPYLQVPRLIYKVQKLQYICLMIETAKSNQAKAKRKLEAVREKQKEVNTNNQKKLYQWMFLLYHQRKESQSKCELSYFYTSQKMLCQLSKE